jgi:hypothetical protein
MDHRLVYYAALAIATGLAFRRGGTCERHGAATAVLASLASTLAANRFSWASLDVELFVIDLAVLGSFWWLSLTSNRYWPYWVTGWQLVAVLVHVQRAIFADILPAPYALLSMYLAYPMLLLIAVASLRPRFLPVG